MKMWERINKFVHMHTILSVCIVCVIFYAILLALYFPLENMTASGGMTVRTLVWLLLSAIIVWLMRKIQVFSINDFSFGYMGKRKFLAFSGIAFATIGLLFTFTQLPEYRFIAPNPLDFFIAASSQLVGVGIYEEVLFRGLLLKLLLKKMGQSKRGIINACLISSAVFGITHISNIISVVRYAEQLSVSVVLPIISQVIFTSAFGVLAVALFLRSGTLWVPILLHGIGNLAVQIFVALVSRDWILQFVETPIKMSFPEFVLSMLLPTIPFLVAGLLLLRKVKPNEITAEVSEHC